MLISCLLKSLSCERLSNKARLEVSSKYNLILSINACFSAVAADVALAFVGDAFVAAADAVAFAAVALAAAAVAEHAYSSS